MNTPQASGGLQPIVGPDDVRLDELAQVVSSLERDPDALTALGGDESVVESVRPGAAVLARSVDDIVATIIHGGKIALLGLYGQRPDIDLNQAILKGLTIRGIYGRELFETWYKATGMLRSGLDISPVITHTYPLEAFEEAFDQLRTGSASKILFDLGS